MSAGGCNCKEDVPRLSLALQIIAMAEVELWDMLWAIAGAQDDLLPLLHWLFFSHFPPKFSSVEMDANELEFATLIARLDSLIQTLVDKMNSVSLQAVKGLAEGDESTKKEFVDIVEEDADALQRALKAVTEFHWYMKVILDTSKERGWKVTMDLHFDICCVLDFWDPPAGFEVKDGGLVLLDT